MSEKPRVLIVDDEGQVVSYTLLIARLIEIRVVSTWRDFDEVIGNGIEGYAAAVVMPLIRMPSKERRSILEAIRALRRKFASRPIFSFMAKTNFHSPMLDAGLTAIALRPREIEALLAKALSLPYTAPVYVPAPSSRR